MPSFSTAEDWIPGEQVTDVKLDNIINSLEATPSFISGKPALATPTGAETFNVFDPVSGLIKQVTMSTIPGTSTQTSPTYVLLTDAATVTQTCNANKVYQNARVVLNVAGATRALVIASSTDGMFGAILVTQDGTGGRAMTLSGTNVALGIGTISALDLAPGPNESTLCCWTYINGTYYWTFAKMVVGTPYCRATTSGAQSLTSGVITVLTFGTESNDNDSMHSVVTNTSRITASRPGIYMLSGYIAFASNSTGERYADILLNSGGTITTQRQPATTTSEMNISTVYPLNKGDYVELRALQSSGGALNVTTAVWQAVQAGVL